MKKLLVAIISILLALSLFTGCSSQAGLTLSGSYFLDDSTNLSVGQIDETSVYKVEFKAREGSAVKLSLTSGTYTTHLFTSTYNGTKCYEYSTVLDTTGSYKIGDNEEEPFTDKIETVAYFLGVDNNLKPLYSKRTVKAHSIVSTTDGYSTKYYEYELETKYENDTATITFTPNEASTGSYNLSSGEHKFEKIYEKSYFDNEMMLIAMRAMNLHSSYTASFTTIDALSNVKRQLQLTPNAETPNETLEITYTNSGEKISKVETLKYGLAIAGTFTGSPIILNYADRTQPKEGQRLVKMQVEAPLNMGTFTYTITNVAKK